MTTSQQLPGVNTPQYNRENGTDASIPTISVTGEAIMSNPAREPAAPPEPMGAGLARPHGSLTPGGFQFMNRVTGELAGGRFDIPGFPQLATRLRLALIHPHSPMEQAAKVAAENQVLAEQLIAMANSIGFAYVGKPISKLPLAIGLLGRSITLAGAFAFAMAEICRSGTTRAVEEHLAQLWSDSTHRAALCFVLARRSSASPDQAFLTGLLHGIGKLHLLLRAANEPEVAHNSSDLSLILRTWHIAFGASLVEHWDLPKEISDAIERQNDFKWRHYGSANVTDVLVCANILASFGEDPDALEAALRDVESARLLKLDPQKAASILSCMKTQIDALRATLNRFHAPLADTVTRFPQQQC